MKNIVQSVKGTRDFYPEDMAARQWLYGLFKEVSESFGYREWEAPILESIDLYRKKSGSELADKQSYSFEDRGGETITLRPELTPSLARMIAQRQGQLTFPVRWWSFGPFWRYERPQKGRTREFFQWNLDLIGAPSPEADAEIATVLITFFKKAGLSPNQVIVAVNNRRLMDAELADLGIDAEQRPNVGRFIDRRDKLSEQEWLAYGQEMGLTERQVDGIRKILGSSDLWKKSEELVRYFKALEALGVMDYVRYDPGIVRGLDYYTGIVFEAMDLSGGFRRSIMGGGRYENLLAAVGGDPLTATGFAMGDVVIMGVLQQAGLAPTDLGMQNDTILVTIFDEESVLDSYRLAEELRRQGLKVACYPEAAKLPKQFKYADKYGMRAAVVVGPEERLNGTVSVKDLKTGEQVSVARAEAAAGLKKLLDGAPAS
jgi:histidyl-tRNA synthetase